MSFKRGLWAAEFPEPEDYVGTQRLTTSYARVTVPAAPIVVEVNATRDCWIYRGPMALTDDRASVHVRADTVRRMALDANDRALWARSARGQATLSVRAWRRYPPLFCPPLAGTLS